MFSLINKSTFLKNYKFTFILFILLYIALYAMECRKLTYVITEFAIILLMLLIFSRIKVLNILVLILLSFIISLELSFFIIFSEPITPIILSSIPQTNAEEAKTVLPLLKAVIPLFMVLSLLFWQVLKEFSHSSFIKLLAVCLVLLVIFTLGTAKMMQKFYKNSNQQHFHHILSNGSLLQNILYFREPFMERFPIIIGNLVYLLGDFLEMHYISQNTFHDAIPEGINLNQQPTKLPTKIIIVLGESSVSDNYSLYDYPFKTTPRLDQLYQDKQIIKYDSVITGIPNTKESIRLAFSYATATNPEPFFNNKNIVEMANAAGFQTVWLASVPEKGMYATYSGMVASSSNIFFDPLSHKDLRSQEDLDLPALLKSYYQPGNKQFIVLHLQGSHIPYNYHYDKQDKALITTPENTNYDRTIHHTDRLLAEVIAIIKQQDEDSILLYFADHGEIINKGHGFANAPLSQYKIPLISYQHNNTYDIEKLVNRYRNKHGILNLINMTYIMTELLGYQVAQPVQEQARKDGELVLKTDLKPYSFAKLQAQEAESKAKASLATP